MKRYRDYNGYLRELFGERVQKIPLDAGLTCPNRDGTLSYGGCIYCDRRGSGTGAMMDKALSVEEQITRGCRFAAKRYGARKYIAYFQSFSNTYGPSDRLRDLYDQALKEPGVVGLSIGTRVDCIDPSILQMLQSYQKDYLVWLEYGLQSAHNETLVRINRGHDVACFERAVRLTADYGINVCAHVILGLPGEDRGMMLATARFLSDLPVQGIKIHLLYVVRGTVLGELYDRGAFRCLEREAYIDLVVDFLEILPPDMVIQRLTGDPPGGELVAPAWATHKLQNLNLIQSRLETRNTWQGRLAGKGGNRHENTPFR
ncbi:MAG: TIGR01212 family radical SAM protein [Desulfatiglandales bacterium]